MTESKKQQDENTPKPDPALGRLARLVGRWIMQGRSVGSEEDNIAGTTTFKWVHGNKGSSFFLQQNMELDYAGTEIKSREIIGYNSKTKSVLLLRIFKHGTRSMAPMSGTSTVIA